jgi:hypothetical protein
MSQLTVARITKVNQKLPDAGDSVLNLNLLNFFSNNVIFYQNELIELSKLSPYTLRDSNGHIFENIWQFSKLYPALDAQQEIKSGTFIWDHPSEKHIENGSITKAFWFWRSKGYINFYPVRYPNGYKGKHLVKCALWKQPAPNGKNIPDSHILTQGETGLKNIPEEWVALDYINSRKYLYCQMYCLLVRQQPAYKKLKALYDSGVSMQICEIDVRPGIITREFLEEEINRKDVPFGHGFVLACMLTGNEDLFFM